MDYKVQSVLFLKSKWSETTATDWLVENSYKIKKVDVTEKYLRFRQINPEYLKRLGYTHFVNKKIGKGINLIIAYKEQQGGAVSASNVKRFVEASYKKKADENINDYILDKSLSNDYAKTYFNPKTHQAVVVHRGTSGASDWLNNVAYATGLYNFTNRYKTGKKIQEKASKKYGKSNISTLGHSQGAVLSRKLGQESKEIINLNPAYMGEAPTKKEYNIRSSSDLVSGILAPVNVLKSTLYPSYTKNHEITIQSENPVDVLTEHSPEILNRLDPDRMIGKGMGGGIESNDYLVRVLYNGYNKLKEIKQEAQQEGNTELMGNMDTPFAQLFSQLYSELMVYHLDTTLEGEKLNSYLSSRIQYIEDLMGTQFLEYDDEKLGGMISEYQGGVIEIDDSDDEWFGAGIGHSSVAPAPEEPPEPEPEEPPEPEPEPEEEEEEEESESESTSSISSSQQEIIKVENLIERISNEIIRVGNELTRLVVKSDRLLYKLNNEPMSESRRTNISERLGNMYNRMTYLDNQFTRLNELLSHQRDVLLKLEGEMMPMGYSNP